jgi:thioredoxin reductase
MHDLIALDGLVPSDFRAAAREQLLRYQSVSYEPTEISAVQKFTAHNRTFFAAKDESGKVWLGKYLVLAVGVQEQLKTTPGFDQLWGGSAFWCLCMSPYLQHSKN